MAEDAGARLFFYSIFGLGFGIYSFFRGFKWMKQKRLIEDTPTSKVRSLAMGIVEVYGSVVPDKKVLTSPLSNTDCVYYRYEVQQYRSNGKSSSWVTLKKGEDSTQFYLKDDTGQVLVDARDAEVDTPMDYTYETSSFTNSPKPILSFLDANKIGYKGFFKPRLRFQEYLLEPKDKLYIMGTAGKNPFVKSSARHEELIMIQKGENNPMFYISESSEKAVLKNLKWKIIWGMYGGGALAVVCLAYIFIYLGIL